MKELSIEQKAQRYDEVVERAKIEKEKSRNLGLLEFIENNFPELEESEGEKIRKDIIHILKGELNYTSKEDISKYIAWLEKQGEQKSAWSEEDERNLNDAILFIETGTYSLDKDNLINWLKSVRPQNMWKPTDEQIQAVKEAACYSSVFSEKTIDSLISLSKQLKKLREE